MAILPSPVNSENETGEKREDENSAPQPYQSGSVVQGLAGQDEADTTQKALDEILHGIEYPG